MSVLDNGQQAEEQEETPAFTSDLTPTPAPTSTPAPAAVAPQLSDFDTMIKHMEGMAGAFKKQKELLMTDVEKRFSEIQKEREIQGAKVAETLEKFQKYAAEKLPAIIKQNVEANYYQQSKEIVNDVEKELRESLTKTFGEFGKTLTEYENRINKATEIVRNKSEQPLHITFIHGAKWLAISLAFTFLVIKSNNYLDKKDVDYGYRAKVAIQNLSPGYAKEFNDLMKKIK